MPDTWQRLSPLLDELFDLDAPARAARLAEIEAEDPRLAAELRRLLAADQGSGMLDGGVVKAAPTVMSQLAEADGADPALSAKVGKRVGNYCLLERVGSGGMGEVWRGERSDGEFEQQVAIKLIRPLLDSAELRERFARERRILARLDHPNIARLLDGGVTEDGTPYYAMEFVRGIDVVRYADGNHLDTRARVELMLQVCAAVAHAQTQLVVHRDLKPSNILVDAQGRVRVLDFGIARLLDDGADTQLTGTGMRVFSPAYAAPEQIRGETAGTTADVYALGAVLYELLTGRVPHPQRAAGLERLLAGLARETLTRPSVALREHADAATTAGRHSTRSHRELAGDLDTIIGTALQADPVRRYAGAAQFGEDLRRWLDGRPIAARPDTAGYRMRKFVARHRIVVAAAALVVLALIVGLGVALTQAARAQAAALVAEQQAVRAERVKDYLLALFREQDPLSRAQARQRSASELIAEGLRRADSLAADPILHAAVRSDLAEVQAGLGNFESARGVFEEVLAQRRKLFGADSAEVGQTLAALGATLMALGDVKAAEPMIRDALRLLRAGRGADDLETAKAESNLARVELAGGDTAAALVLAQHVVEVYTARFGAEHAEVGARLASLGAVYEQMDKLTEAEEVSRRALAITERERGAEHLATVFPRTRLGDILRRRRNYPDAEIAYQQALSIARAQLPAQHVMLGQIGMRLGDLQRRQRNYAAAEATLAAAEPSLLAVNAPEYGQVQQYRGRIAEEQFDYANAVRYYSMARDHFEKVAGDSVFTWSAACNLVVAQAEHGELAAAEALGRAAVAAMQRLTDAQSYDSATAYRSLGWVLTKTGAHSEAKDLLRRTLQITLSVYGEAHAGVAEARLELALALIVANQPATRVEAGALLDQAASVLEKDVSTQPRVGELWLARARLAIANGDDKTARSALQQATTRLLRDQGAASPRTREALALASKLSSDRP